MQHSIFVLFKGAFVEMRDATCNVDVGLCHDAEGHFDHLQSVLARASVQHIRRHWKHRNADPELNKVR